MTRVTREMVFKAANEINLEGKTPRVPEIRTKLGVGSYTTIQQYLKEWKESQEEQKEEEISEDAPVEIKQRLETFSSQIWNFAIQVANERLQEERDALEETKQQMDEIQKETAETADQLAAELEKTQEALKDAADLLELEKVAHEGTNKMLDLETDNVIKLTAVNEANQKHIDHLQKSEQATLKLLEETINRYDQEIWNLKSQKDTEIAELKSKHKEDIAQLNDVLDQTNERNALDVKFYDDELKKAQASAQASQLENAALQAELKALKAQIQKQDKMINDFFKKQSPKSES